MTMNAISTISLDNNPVVLTGNDAGGGTKKKQARRFMKRLRSVTGIPLPVAARIAKKFVRNPWGKAQWAPLVNYENISLVAVRGEEYDEIFLVVSGPKGTAAMYA